MESAWATIGILAVGMITVVGGVLALRLHAFLALVLGALIVGLLTPRWAVERFGLEQEAIPIESVELSTGTVVLQTGGRPGTVLLVVRRDPRTDRFEPVNELLVGRVETVSDSDGSKRSRCIARIENPGPGAAVLAGDLVVTPAARADAADLAGQSIGERIARGFGGTCAKIGILIAMASIIGKCLLDSGAADRVVRVALRLFGERGAPKAFLGSGFLLGIPVFFDTVFYLMVPLGKAMRMRTGHGYLFYILTIVAGATMAHSLVPPTPGPLFVAEQLGIDVGVMILAGCVVGLCTVSCGYVFAAVADRRGELPLRETPDFSLEDLRSLSERDERSLPPLALSLLPVVLPVILIGGLTVLKPFSANLPAGLMQLAGFVGNKNIALMISAAIAMYTLVRQYHTSLKDLSVAVGSALSGAGTIILITAAGGAFGGILQQTNVAGLMGDLPRGSPTLVLTVAFFVTAAIRTAQGSATVAMITSAGVFAGIGSAETLGFHPVYLALVIGCGSKPIPWMNDSGFWVVGKMSGMTEAETLKYVSPMLSLMGVAGWLLILIGAALFPMV